MRPWTAPLSSGSPLPLLHYNSFDKRHRKVPIVISSVPEGHGTVHTLLGGAAHLALAQHSLGWARARTHNTQHTDRCLRAVSQSRGGDPRGKLMGPKILTIYCISAHAPNLLTQERDTTEPGGTISISARPSPRGGKARKRDRTE